MQAFIITNLVHQFDANTGNYQSIPVTTKVQADLYIPTPTIANFYVEAQKPENIVASFYNVVSVVREPSSAWLGAIASVEKEVEKVLIMKAAGAAKAHVAKIDDGVVKVTKKK